MFSWYLVLGKSLPSITLLHSGLNWDLFGLWRNQEACSRVIVHGWVCSFSHLSICIQSSCRALTLKWACGPDDSCHLILLTLCLYLHLGYHPSTHSFNKHHWMSMGRELPLWVGPTHPPILKFLFLSPDSPSHLAGLGFLVCVLPSQLYFQPLSPSGRHSSFSGQGYPEPCEIFAVWKMEMNRFFPRKGEVLVFTEPKFMKRVAMWAYSNEE